MHTNSLNIVLINKFSQIFKTESIDDFLLVVRIVIFDQPKIDLLQNVLICVQSLIRQDRVLQDLSHEYWSFENVLP